MQNYNFFQAYLSNIYALHFNRSLKEYVFTAVTVRPFIYKNYTPRF